MLRACGETVLNVEIPAWRILPGLCKYLGSPLFTNHGKAIWKGSHNPSLRRLTNHSYWLLTSWDDPARWLNLNTKNPCETYILSIWQTKLISPDFLHTDENTSSFHNNSSGKHEFFFSRSPLASKHHIFFSKSNFGFIYSHQTKTRLQLQLNNFPKYNSGKIPINNIHNSDKN